MFSWCRMEHRGHPWNSQEASRSQRTQIAHIEHFIQSMLRTRTHRYVILYTFFNRFVKSGFVPFWKEPSSDFSQLQYLSDVFGHNDTDGDVIKEKKDERKQNCKRLRAVATKRNPHKTSPSSRDSPSNGRYSLDMGSTFSALSLIFQPLSRDPLILTCARPWHSRPHSRPSIYPCQSVLRFSCRDRKS